VVVNAQTGAEDGDRPSVEVCGGGEPAAGVVVINQVDHPKADSRIGRHRMIETAAGEVGGGKIVPVQLPIVDQHGFSRGGGPGDDEGLICISPMGTAGGEVGVIPEAIKADAKAATRGAGGSLWLRGKMN